MKIYLYNDVAFSWVFGRQEQIKPITSVLNAVIGYDSADPKFRDIRILNPFDITKYKTDKRGILDLRVRDMKADIWFNVEMQVRYQKFYPERSMFYLAGMYRDQMKAGEVYQELKPCFGVHIVMADMFEQETDWYNHYRMLNVKSHKPLSRHWEMYFVELGKFKKALKKGKISSRNILGQWCDYLAKPHDSSEKLDESFKNNKGIQEVHEMLREFTEDERLREQYRLHEEWLRNQRSSERAMREALEKEKQMRKKAEKKAEAKTKKAEAEKKKAEAEKKKLEKKAEAEKKKAEAEKKKLESVLKEKDRRSVLALRKTGESDKSIADLLGIPENEVKRIRDD